MSTLWVLVANASQAHLYATARLGGALEIVKEFSHPQSREKGLNLVTDRPGQKQTQGAVHGGAVEKTDPKEVEAEKFAKELAVELDEGRTSHQFAELVLIAPPHFHGLLNKHCNPQTLNMVSKKLQKDYTHMRAKELSDYFGSLPRWPDEK